MVNRLFLIILLATTYTFSQNISISDIMHSKELHGKTLSDVRWLSNDKSFTFTKKGPNGIDLWICDAQSGKSQLLFDAATLPLKASQKEKRFTLPNYIWSPDDRFILFPSENDLFLFDVKTRSFRRLTHDKAKERDPAFSPDGSKIAYLKNLNLAILNLSTGREIMLTSDGSDDLLIGRFDWTYEEEFSIRTGFEWSPDSRHISFFQLDVSPVPPFPIVSFDQFQNSVEMMRYSKAGDANANVKIGVIDSDTPKIIWMDCRADADSSYIPRTAWFPSGDKLAITWLNRRQNFLKLLKANIHSGKTSLLLEERSTTGWVEAERKPMFVDDHSFVWLSEKDGYNHIYFYDLQKKKTIQLTRGVWDVKEIKHSDDEFVYFTAFKESITNLDFYRVPLTGIKLTKLSQQSGYHTIKMSPKGGFYLDNFSNLTTPAGVSLHHSNGDKIVQLTNPPEKAIALMQNINFETIEIPLPGRTLDALLIKPSDFDPNIAYPLLIFCYGGPASHLVRNNWHHPRTLWHSLLVEKGYLVLMLDPRGTADRGVEWKHRVYKRMGDVEIEDHIDAARWAGELPYVDKNRIGIWGWSYGGYTTIMSMLKGADVFAAGVAVAPVTDWRHYDSIYTERSMNLPHLNEAGYKAGSTLNYAHQLEGALYIMHGSSDYNVHLSNSMQLIEKFQNLGKDFDFMIYPGKTHGLLGAKTRVHVYEQIYDFIVKNL